MIRSLRIAHRRAVLGLAIAVPALVVAGLAARQPMPVSAARTPEMRAPAPGDRIQDRSRIWDAVKIRTRVWVEPAGRIVLELEPEVDLQRPDLLVYWSANPREEPDRLPDEAQLLGTLAGIQGRRFVLPEMARNAGGWICIYSLGHQELVATAWLAAIGS